MLRCSRHLTGILPFALALFCVETFYIEPEGRHLEEYLRQISGPKAPDDEVSTLLPWVVRGSTDRGYLSKGRTPCISPFRVQKCPTPGTQ